MSPPDVAALSIYQVHLLLCDSCERFENKRLHNKHNDAMELEREVLDELAAIPSFATSVARINRSDSLRAAREKRLRELRMQFTGSEELTP